MPEIGYLPCVNNYSFVFDIYKIDMNNFIVSFLIYWVDEDDEERVLAVQETVDGLIAKCHPAPFQSQGYSFPQNPGQPEDIFTIRVTGSEFYITMEELQQEMILQGV